MKRKYYWKKRKRRLTTKKKKNSKAHNHRVDNWALGVLTYEFLVGDPPFMAQTHRATYRRIVEVDLHFPKEVPHDARDFIMRLLKRKPEERMALSDVPKHPWIAKHRMLAAAHKIQYEKENA